MVDADHGGCALRRWNSRRCCSGNDGGAVVQWTFRAGSKLRLKTMMWQPSIGQLVSARIVATCQHMVGLI